MTTTQLMSCKHGTDLWICQHEPSKREIITNIYLNFVSQLNFNIDFPTHINLTSTVINNSILIKDSNNIKYDLIKLS